jgi:hypothetical protein
LPVAWSCRAATDGGIVLPGEDCTQEINPDPENDPYNPEYTYLAMDSVKVAGGKGGGHCDPDETDPTRPQYCYEQKDITCAVPDPNTCISTPTGTQIDCDIDNDCVNEIMTGGARAWLDLDGPSGGANQLMDWIQHPETVPEISVHDWLPSAGGTERSVFRVATILKGTDVVLPVFSNLCKTGIPNIYSNQTDPESTDNCTYSDLDDLSLAGSNTNYHIYSFSAFHVTCVQTGRNANRHVYAEDGYEFDNSKNWCNGHYAAWNNGSIDENDKTIEGYFIILDLGGYAGAGHWNNTGTFTVVLTK